MESRDALQERLREKKERMRQLEAAWQTFLPQLGQSPSYNPTTTLFQTGSSIPSWVEYKARMMAEYAAEKEAVGQLERQLQEIEAPPSIPELPDNREEAAAVYLKVKKWMKETTGIDPSRKAVEARVVDLAKVSEAQKPEAIQRFSRNVNRGLGGK